MWKGEGKGGGGGGRHRAITVAWRVLSSSVVVFCNHVRAMVLGHQ